MKDISIAVVLLMSLVTVIAVLWTQVLNATLVLIVMWLASLFFWHGKRDILVFVLGAIIGPLAEIILIRFGVWSYALPSFLGIPAWLIVGWGLAFLFINKFAVSIASRRGWK